MNLPIDNQSGELKKTWILAVILLIGAPIIYLIIIGSLSIAPRTGGEVDLLFYIFLIVSIVEPVLIPVIERYQINMYQKSRFSRMSPGQLFTSISIIKFALIETIYIYGLIMYLFSADFLKVVYFYLIGITWSVIHWPRRSSWDKFRKVLDKNEHR